MAHPIQEKMVWQRDISRSSDASSTDYAVIIIVYTNKKAALKAAFSKSFSHSIIIYNERHKIHLCSRAKNNPSKIHLPFAHTHDPHLLPILQVIVPDAYRRR
jgi:hypothetical protein